MDYTPILISIKTTALATFFAFIVGLFAASKVRKIKKFRGIIDGILTLPMVLPPTVVGFFLILIFGKNGWIGSLLDKAGISIMFSWQATVIAATVVAFPLMYRATLSTFDDMDENTIFAARTLGLSEIRIFWTIIFPNSLSGIMAGTVLALARALGEFGATMMLAGNIKGKTQTISIAIYTAMQAGDRQMAYEWTIVMMIMSFSMMVAMNYFNKRNKRIVKTAK
jgi:molybdate transport system permease protein